MSPAGTHSTQELMRSAVSAHQQGRLDEAESFYVRLLEQDPSHGEALRLGGIVARQRGDLSLALARLIRAAEVAPEDPDCLTELGLSFLAGADLQAAEAALRGALQRDGSSLKALANLGAVLQYRQHLSEAIDCYRRVLEACPDDLETRANLANALLDRDCGTQALAECDAGLGQFGSHHLLLSTKGAILNGLGRFEPAVDVLKQALVLNPRDDVAMINLAYAQRRLDRADAAIETLRQTLKINPDNARAMADLINLLAGTDEANEALDLAQTFLERYPGDRQVLAAYALALGDRGDAKAAGNLLDYDHLLTVIDMPAPSGFDTLTAFNSELADILQHDPSMTISPVTKATRGGGQTGELDLDQNPTLAALQELICAGINTVIQQLGTAEFADHPAMAYATAHWSLRAWGTVLMEGGHQIPHMHPVGWLSGVYYVRLPDNMGVAGPQAGWLEFGKPTERWLVAKQPELRAVEPREGRLVLFPSYFFHRTRIFKSSERRVSIAFDVVPTVL